MTSITSFQGVTGGKDEVGPTIPQGTRGAERPDAPQSSKHLGA